MADRVRNSRTKVKRLGSSAAISQRPSISHSRRRKQTPPTKWERAVVIMEEPVITRHDHSTSPNTLPITLSPTTDRVLFDYQYGNGHSIQGGSSSNDVSFNRTSSPGSVVDLTNDSSVLDVEEIVDLTESPHPLRISTLGQRPSCRFTNSHGPPVSSHSQDVVFVNSSNDDVIILNSPSRKRLRGNGIYYTGITREPQRQETESTDNTNSATATSSSDGSTKTSLSCPVCLQSVTQFEAAGRKLVTTICGHVFCNSCIRKAISTTQKCPSCRRKLTLKQYHPLFI